jgi:tripartite-type tricarboxylate transporter receptor subunit TctC
MNNPLAIRYGSPAANIELYMALLKQRSGLVAESIPYKSTTEVVTAILAGDVVMTFNSLQIYLPHIKNGTLRAIMVAAGSRSSLLPDVPSSTELGLQNFDMAQNHGFWAPPGTPLPIRQRLSAEVTRAVKLPEIANFIRNTLASEPVGSSPEEQLKVHEKDIRILTEAIRLTNYQPQ